MAKSITRVRASGPYWTGDAGMNGSRSRVTDSSATARVEPTSLTRTGLADCAAERSAGADKSAAQMRRTAANMSARFEFENRGARFAFEGVEALIVRGSALPVSLQI